MTSIFQLLKQETDKNNWANIVSVQPLKQKGQTNNVSCFFLFLNETSVFDWFTYGKEKEN